MIAITGATGHIGNVLVRKLLERGDEVRALIPPFEDTTPLRGLEVEQVEGDVLDLDSLRRAFEGCDTVFHLAGVISIASGKSDLLNRVNVDGTRNAVEACLGVGVRRLVYTSSIHAIVEPPRGTVIDETCGFNPDVMRWDYDRSKARATLEVLKAGARGLDAVVVCPTGVTGPYDFRVSEVGQLIVDYARRKMKAYMDGAYDFVDVRDVAAGHILAAEKGRPGEAYILSGERITVSGLMSLLEEVTGVPRPRLKLPNWLVDLAGALAPLYSIVTRSRPLVTTYSLHVLRGNSVVSSAKARSELGYTSRPLRESIEDAFRWLRDNHKL
ncbi:MAG TPA: SDR family oxidoreductase [Firmicutes bacterium]|nr:SDR family oxidoreductase [Bacillota bacterium]